MMKSSRLLGLCLGAMLAYCGSAFAESPQRVLVVGAAMHAMADYGHDVYVECSAVLPKRDIEQYAESTGGSTMSMLSNQFIANGSGASFKGVQPITSASISSGYTS